MMVPGDADEGQPLAEEPPGEGDPRLEVVGHGEGLFILGGGPAEAVDDLLDGDERDVPLLGGQDEEAQPVLAHPLLDEPGHLRVGEGERGDGHRLLEDLLQGDDVVPGHGLVVVPDVARPAGQEFRRELEKEAVDAGDALAVEVVHQPPQDALVEDRIGLLEEVHDHDPFRLPLPRVLGPIADPGSARPGVPFFDEPAEAVGGQLDELLFLEKEGIFAAARGLSPGSRPRWCRRGRLRP